MSSAFTTLMELRQRLLNERGALSRKIEGIEFAITELGYSIPTKTPLVVAKPAKPVRKPRRGTTRDKVGHSLTYLVKEALYDGPKNLRDLGTYLARRGVDPVVPNNVSVVLSTMKAEGDFERSEEGVWCLSQNGRAKMDSARQATG